MHGLRRRKLLLAETFLAWRSRVGKCQDVIQDFYYFRIIEQPSHLPRLIVLYYPVLKVIVHRLISSIC